MRIHIHANLKDRAVAIGEAALIASGAEGAHDPEAVMGEDYQADREENEPADAYGAVYPAYREDAAYIYIT